MTAPEAAIATIATHLRTDGYELQTYSVIDRYLETTPHVVDSVPGRAGSVVIRIWADPAAGRRTRITAEAVYERIADPSRPRRDREELAPYRHPVRVYLRELLRSLKTSVNLDANE